MTPSDARPVGETAEAVKLAEPFAPRTYRSAWIHDRLVTAEEWLAAEAEVDETMDRADPDDDGLFRGGDLRAIAREITELRRAAKTWADECTRRAALLSGAPALWVEVRENGDVFLREVDQRTREPFGPSYEAMHPFHAVGDILAPGEAAVVRLCKEETPT